MVILSLLFTYFYEDEIMDYLEIPLKNQTVYLMLCMTILTIINPFLEEWFWYTYFFNI